MAIVLQNLWRSGQGSQGRNQDIPAIIVTIQFKCHHVIVDPLFVSLYFLCYVVLFCFLKVELNASDILSSRTMDVKKRAQLLVRLGESGGSIWL
jgi:hypothetical protein